MVEIEGRAIMDIHFWCKKCKKGICSEVETQQDEIYIECPYCQEEYEKEIERQEKEIKELQSQILKLEKEITRLEEST